MWLIVIVSSIWVYFDAKSIGARKDLVPGFFNLGPVGWALCSLLIWIIAFPAYLIKRSDIKNAAEGNYSPPTHTHTKQSGLNTAAKFIAIGWTVFVAVGVITGLISVSSSMPTSGNEYETAGFAIGTTIGLGMWFIAWAAIAIPATIVFLVTRNSGTTVIVEPPPVKITPPEKTKQCPYCAETIKEEAIFCRYCQKSLVAEEPKEEPKEQPNEPKKDWAKQGAELIKTQDYKAAVSAFSTAINESPSGELYFARAVAYSKMKDKSKTIADLQLAADLGHERAQKTLSSMSPE